ncbi:hypothetical protein PTSG_09383 [Salpingoeca rosetta]|uniref:Neutral ceramidase n=1 Tax=Salpingoeca rosetta (strain ATCC 50818 / BSB-021) TaxID=946362 RepID=F2UMG7_SALR5|nr:uncharacterized protein PTSG_09383 [Salpingoeca rosetta]EGD78316.1 hypothetical protein PTSG_09383 [Salpingoeca rosetta]|eukprot:XP_004989639.1 hypothetical protein PTSG_09383 [Salpingoeca rosetta]
MAPRLVVVAVLLLAAPLCSLAQAVKDDDNTLYAGVAHVNATLPLGVPLAGYNHGDRRVPYWPIPNNTAYTTFMTPSVGVMDDTNVRCLALRQGNTRAFIVTADAIGADGTLRKLAVVEAQRMGSNATLETVTLHASHSHSGPGAVSPSFLWAMAPATDLLVPELQFQLAVSIGQAIVMAEKAMVPASLGVDISLLPNVTVNRRAKISPYLQPDSIDPNLGVIRVDDLKGNPLATIWNFAIHGTCFGPDNMKVSSDIMGGVNNLLVKNGGVGVTMFINADAGDIDPAPQTCQGKPNYNGAPTIANAIIKTRKAIKPSANATFRIASEVVPFGPTNLNVTLQRFENCTSGGPLDICTLCEVIHCDLNLHLGSSWIENAPRFTAIRFDVDGSKTLMVTMPGEPLSELGTEVRIDGVGLGFDRVLLAGYSNNHMGYFATPDEYDIGGYESQLTFWGIDTSKKVRDACRNIGAKVIN